MAETSSRIGTRRRWRRAVAAVAGMVAAGALTACTTESPSGGESSSEGLTRSAKPGAAESKEHLGRVNVGIMGKVPQLDPVKGSEEGLTFNANFMEPLLRVDSKGQIQPWLATGFEAISDTVYEYTLREGVTFWNGAEMTSEDVKYSWDRQVGAGRRPDFASVASIETPDDHTVRVTLSRADASWQYAPTMFYSAIYEKAFVEKSGDAFGQPDTLVMGTGAWRIDSLNPTSGMELSAYDGYWGGKPPIDQVAVKFFADNASMALALRAGEIDVAPNINEPETFDAAAGGGTTTTQPICSTSVISLPTKIAPFDDIHVRRAIAYAINREDVIGVTRGRASGPNYTLFTPALLRALAPEDEVEKALSDVETYSYDVDKAKAELAKSPVPDGFRTEFRTIPAYASVAQVVAAQMKEIGIDAQVVQVGDTQWYGEILSENPPFTFTENTLCTPDPSGAAIFLTSVNIAQYESREVTDLLAEGLAVRNPERRLEIYADVLERLGEDVPYVPVYSEANTYASTKYDIADYAGGQWANFPWLLNLVPR